MPNTKRRLSEAERAERRRRDRERLRAAAEQLLTSAGWQRWVRVRSQAGLARLCVLSRSPPQLEGLQLGELAVGGHPEGAEDVSRTWGLQSSSGDAGGLHDRFDDRGQGLAGGFEPAGGDEANRAPV